MIKLQPYTLITARSIPTTESDRPNPVSEGLVLIAQVPGCFQQTSGARINLAETLAVTTDAGTQGVKTNTAKQGLKPASMIFLFSTIQKIYILSTSKILKRGSSPCFLLLSFFLTALVSSATVCGVVLFVCVRAGVSADLCLCVYTACKSIITHTGMGSGVMETAFNGVPDRAAIKSQQLS